MFKSFQIHLLPFFLMIMSLIISKEVQGQVVVERDLNVMSSFLQKEVSLNIILPENYYKEDKKYPVVYLLHGFEGDHTNWIDLAGIDQLIDSLTSLGELCACIYILPDAGNSYYINNYDSSLLYEDFFIRELLPWVDSSYRTEKQQSARAIMGLSMGGFGSIILALKHPEIFGTVVALSPSVRNDEMLIALSPARYETLFSSIYGPELAGQERINKHWKGNSPYYIIDQQTASKYRNINWYLACGSSDFLLPSSRAFHELLTLQNIPNEYVISPGKHDWDYWRSSAVPALLYLNKKICY